MEEVQECAFIHANQGGNQDTAVYQRWYEHLRIRRVHFVGRCFGRQRRKDSRGTSREPNVYWGRSHSLPTVARIHIVVPSGTIKSVAPARRPPLPHSGLKPPAERYVRQPSGFVIRKKASPENYRNWPFCFLKGDSRRGVRQSTAMTASPNSTIAGGASQVSGEGLALAEDPGNAQFDPFRRFPFPDVPQNWGARQERRRRIGQVPPGDAESTFRPGG